MINYELKKTLKDIDFTKKKVIVRCDFNVPIKNGVIEDDTRIVSALETIKYLIKNNCKIILISHLGRVVNQSDCINNSLKPVAHKVAKLLNKNVLYIDENVGKQVEDTINQMKFGDVILLKNTRCQDVYNKKESSNNSELGKYWASLCDVYVNDAFATAHRAHASTDGIAKYANDSCLGFLVEKEIKSLGKALFNAKKPLIVILGGAKVSDKINTINNLAKIADKLIIGGGMAFTFLKALGHEIGQSLIENDKLELAKNLYNKYKNVLEFPCDFAISKTFSNSVPSYTSGCDIPKNMMGLDIGKKSITKFKNIILSGKTIIWNGPVGVFEFENYSYGTISICQAVAANKKCYSVIGGGDSATAVKKMHYENEFSYISTGGGASLCLLEGKDLVALKNIKNKN